MSRLLRRTSSRHPSSTYPCARRGLRTSQALCNYEPTLSNLRIGRNTRVIFQGFTGRQATANAKESLAWGTNIVGGVTPGRTGEHLGLPVLPSVRKAVEQLNPDATGIYVAAHQAAAAIEEAVEAEVPLIVAVAEHIPLHEMLRIHSMLKTQSKSRLVGANSPGIISAVGKCRIGFQPLPCFSAGRVGIAAKSGTLSYEAVASTTRAGLGQSLCIGVGGDMLPGTSLRESLTVLEQDDDTDAIIIIGEIGGFAEMEAAEWIREYRSRVSTPKPIAALIAGVTEAPGRIMGHAGAFTVAGEPDAREKIDALRGAGATIVDHPAKFGEVIKDNLGGLGRSSLKDSGNGSITSRLGKLFGIGNQRRQIHTVVRRPHPSASARLPAHEQRRHIYLPEARSFDLLRGRGVTAVEDSGRGTQRLLAIGVDRSSRSPCVIACPATDPGRVRDETRRYAFHYVRGPGDLDIAAIAAHLDLSPRSIDSLRRLVRELAGLFAEEEAFLLETKVVERLGEVKVVAAHFGFDDAAFRSGGRHADIHRSLGDTRGTAIAADPAEAEAAEHGIVYIRLPSETAAIGTVVNGAGLAMNTVDRLGGGAAAAPANFLDTGGKATAETVRKSFELVLADPRVRVVFVNIFGGLTLGDMIARGVVLAFREVDVRVPVVVRIRGTNEAEGQRIIAQSGLELFAFDDFEEAAAKAVELARR